MDAAVAGVTQCEVDRCDGTVGWGSSPDENGETSLDALVMDGLGSELPTLSLNRSKRSERSANMSHF